MRKDPKSRCPPAAVPVVCILLQRNVDTCWPCHGAVLLGQGRTVSPVCHQVWLMDGNAVICPSTCSLLHEAWLHSTRRRKEHQSHLKHEHWQRAEHHLGFCLQGHLISDNGFDITIYTWSPNQTPSDVHMFLGFVVLP